MSENNVTKSDWHSDASAEDFDLLIEALGANQGQVREQRISHFQFHFSLGQTF